MFFLVKFQHSPLAEHMDVMMNCIRFGVVVLPGSVVLLRWGRNASAGAGFFGCVLIVFVFHLQGIAQMLNLVLRRRKK